jgi:hypothetical protein
MNIIASIPVDNLGNKLFIKDLREDGERIYVKYRSTLNDIPFIEVEIFVIEGGKSCVITGEDGTILWRFSTGWLHKIKD